MTHEEVIKKIDKYLHSDRHRPIIVDVPTAGAMKNIVTHYNTGNNSVIRAKRFCKDDGMPLIDKLKNTLSLYDGVVFLDGLFYYLFLYGDEILRKELRSMLDMQVKGKLVILTIGCERFLSDFDKRLMDSSRIIIEDGLPEELPCLYFWSKHIAPPEVHINGLGDLCQISALWETGQKDIPILTEKRKADFPDSLYIIAEYSSDYQTLANTFSELDNIGAIAGTNDQWRWLHYELANYVTLGDYISQSFGGTHSLANAIHGFSNYDDLKKWLYFIALRVYGASGNDYLSKVVSKAKSFREFVNYSFCKIFEYSPKDNAFNEIYQQRKNVVSQMANQADEISLFCKQVYSKGKESLFYLTDISKQEKEMTIELLDRYAADYSQSELLSILELTYPDLATYLKPFDFKNDYLNRYFQLYKWCKVTNTILPEQLVMVEEQATLRKYNTWLHPRTSFVDNIPKDKEKSVLYFMDAMGAEYLGYIQNKCFDMGLVFHSTVALCELPSITCLNKEFIPDFKRKGCKVYENRALDSLKHGGNSTYNYENNKLPIHIVEELNILNSLISQLKTINNNQTAYIIADHGSSRLAVIYEKVNKWEVAEKGKHSGRCCPKSDLNEKPEFATEENGFWCLANYDRFKGGRAAIVEVHGGATLEEVTVPIITVRKKQTKITCKILGDTPVIVSFKKKATIKLFVEIQSDKLTIMVNGKSYPVMATGTPYNYTVEMSDIKTTGIYTFDVLLDDMIIAKRLSFEIKKEGASERKFF